MIHKMPPRNFNFSFINDVVKSHHNLFVGVFMEVVVKIMYMGIRLR